MAHLPSELVHSVFRVDVGPARNGYLIKAYGFVHTTGWTHAVLTPYVYVMPPRDGIWDFDFSAQPPSGISGPAVSEIEASLHWAAAPDFRGARVHTKTNVVVGMVLVAA
ncbi:MAG: hypothetical protein WA840_20860 [Caulobacteraceae bacterium]